MRLLVCSMADEASVNIRDSLLELGDWKGIGLYQGKEILQSDEMALVTIDALHLYADDIDRSVADTMSMKIDDVMFLSRHKAASGKPSLTVHPIGNYGNADYGGRPGTLVRSSPDLMTSLLRKMAIEARSLDFEITFEVTHHGPYLETPTMFVEIGSSEATWGHKGAAKAIAASILGLDVSSYPKAIGIGGGHYAPRFTEACMAKKVSFGHMLPNYGIDMNDLGSVKARIAMALEKSSARLAYVHRKSMKRSEATEIDKIINSLGAEVIDSSSLEDL